MEFIWNEHDCCENPKRITFKCIKKHELSIEIAKAPNGKWAYGMNFIGHDEGFGFGCWLRVARFQTENECKQFALSECIEHIQKHRCAEKYKGLIQIVQSEIKAISFPAQPVFVQLSMF